MALWQKSAEALRARGLQLAFQRQLSSITSAVPGPLEDLLKPTEQRQSSVLDPPLGPKTDRTNTFVKEVRRI